MTIAVILAGGRSARMGGGDKAGLLLAGKPLIAHVADRLRAQVDRILISGPPSPFVDCVAVPDSPGAPDGPVGGIYSALNWLTEIAPDEPGFLTVPADGPFLPKDLAVRLFGERSAIAADSARDHPTYAWWRAEDLERVRNDIMHIASVSLMKLSELCAASRFVWRDGDAFFNINTPVELAEAEVRYKEMTKIQMAAR